MVRLEGFEPPTLGSVDRCSNPLSYRRKELRIVILQERPTPYQMARGVSRMSPRKAGSPRTSSTATS